jgi:hypothetical protein
MPRIAFPGFCGGSNLKGLQSLLADADDCLNWFPELVESAGGSNKYVLNRTPGFAVLALT